jgi:hypothetical protein
VRLLVDCLRARYGDDTANWCERSWTGDRDWYCLVHSQYAGCNNNISVEVTWRDIKKSCDSLGALGAFIRTFCRFIATAIGEENMKRLKDDSRVPAAFIRAPRPIKEMWDQLQSAHRLVLSCCIILESPRQHAKNAYIDLMADVIKCGADPASLHLKIEIYHHKRAEEGHTMPLQLSDMKMVLMPRLRLLTQLDPEGLYEFNAPQMRELIRPHAEEFRRVVLTDQLPEDMDVKGALKVYTISNCTEPLQHGVIILCPARARLALRIASVLTPFSPCPYSIPQCKGQRARKGMSEQPCLRGNNARKSVVWLAGGRGVSSRRGKTTRR